MVQTLVRGLSLKQQTDHKPRTQPGVCERDRYIPAHSSRCRISCSFVPRRYLRRKKAGPGPNNVSMHGMQLAGSSGFTPAPKYWMCFFIRSIRTVFSSLSVQVFGAISWPLVLRLKHTELSARDALLAIGCMRCDALLPMRCMLDERPGFSKSSSHRTREGFCGGGFISNALLVSVDRTMP